jgi:hypothetical protein
MTISPIAAPNPGRGRVLLLTGLALPVLGVAAYLVQFSQQRLMLPWYMPAAALLGVALVVASLWRRRTIWRWLGLVAVVLLTALEIAGLSATRLPTYQGPIVEGKSFPAFEAKRADGTRFTQDDLKGDQHQVLVFFRGRW